MNQRLQHRSVSRVLVPAAACLVACGGPSRGTPAGGGTDGSVESEHMMQASRMGTDPESRFGPLEVGMDYLGYRRVTEQPFLSAVHGNRWVHVYVNEVGADAYLGGDEIPVGTVVVKVSWEGAGNAPSATPGPVYVMQKRAPGYAPNQADWYYAIRWENPPPQQKRMYGGPIYWRGRSKRVEYCYDCHDGYDRSLGGLVPSSQLPR